ncbi:MAG: peptidoglycan editing factor PgeF [Christensenellales bacterium]|jgi:YfiH family protein
MTGFEHKYQQVIFGHTLARAGGISFCRLPLLDEAGCDHGFTLRHGGVSPPPMDSLNLGHNRPDDPRNVSENYRRFANAAGFPLPSAAIVSYCHGDGIEVATRQERGWGFPGAPRFPDCDGFVTVDPQVTLITLHADCMPVFLFDPVKKAGGLVHAGWKGASLRVGQKAVLRMVAEFGCKPQDILAGIGPSICKNCFEVDGDVFAVFEKAFPKIACSVYDEKRQKHLIDLWKVMAAQLFEAGVAPEHIQIAGPCTCCEEGYFSYRRDKKLFGGTGAMAAYLRLGQA